MPFEQSLSRDAGSVTSATAQFTGAVKPGSLLVIGARVGATGRSVTASDNVNGAYTAGPAQTAGAYHQGVFFYFKGTAAGTPIITLGITGAAATIRLVVAEYSGVTSLDATGQNNGVGNPVSATGSTIFGAEILIGVATHDNADGTLWTAASSGGAWTKRAEFGGVGSCVLLEDLTVSSTGTQNHNPTVNGTNSIWTSMMQTWVLPASAYNPVHFI